MLQSMGSQRVGHDLATEHTHTHTHTHTHILQERQSSSGVLDKDQGQTSGYSDLS